MPTSDEIVWMDPYSYKRGSWLFNTYDILFEDCKITEVVGEKNAGQLIGQLNGAYNLGRSSAMMEQECRKLKLVE